MSLSWAIRGALFAALAPVGMIACGSSDPSSATPSAAATAKPERTAQPTATVGPASIKVGLSPLGRILVDASGRSLYYFTQDKPGKSVCTADFLNCPTSWPPLMTAGSPHGQGAVKTRLLGSLHRTQPTGSQVTYKGHLLYRYVDDKQPGDVKGQGMYSYWYVLSPSGHPITKKPPA